jgi:hypothetical protein
MATKKLKGMMVLSIEKSAEEWKIISPLAAARIGKESFRKVTINSSKKEDG